MKLRIAIIIGLVLLTLLVFMSSDSDTNEAIINEVKIDNPYEGIDWDNIKQYKGNLHTHTNHKGGRLKIEEVINRYLELKYSVLSITDHNFTNWPWPKESDILPIKGSEISAIEHDLGAYFTEFSKSELSVEQTLSQIDKDNGLAVLFHPGRYRMNISWYNELFQKNHHLIGLEVFNQGNRYKKDERSWDSILTESMPLRPIWGFANDDMHKKKHLGREWNVFLLPDLTEESLREALEKGEFFFSTISNIRRPRGPAPTIDRIEVKERDGKIKIEAKDYNKIFWISEGRVIYRGDELNYKDKKAIGGYVRAVISGPGGQTFTQPFGIISIN